MKRFRTLGLATLGFLFLSALVLAQTSGPIATPQLNTIYFVKQVQGFYPTIQATVTLNCGVRAAEIDILPGATPSDTPGSVTGGCGTVGIVDRRVWPNAVWAWNGSAYIQQGTAPTGNAGGDLSGTYPNPTVAKVNGQAIPTSQNALASDGAGHIVGASNVPYLNGANYFTAPNVFNANVTLQATAAATSAGSVPSPFMNFGGSYWNGTNAVSDSWGARINYGTGANPTSFFQLSYNGGSPGGSLFEVTSPFYAASVSVGNGLSVQGASTFNGASAIGPIAGSSNGSSQTLEWDGFYNTSNKDAWTIQNVIGATGTAPPSVLTFAHAGTSGGASVSIPYATTLQSATLSGLSGSSGYIPQIGAGGLLGVGPQASNLGMLGATQSWTGTNTFASLTDSGLSASSGYIAQIGAGGLLGAGAQASNLALLSGAQTFSGAKTFSSGLNTSFIPGTGTTTFAAGTTAAVGTGAPTPTCVASHVCDSVSGEVSFTTGTGTLTGGVAVTMTMPSGIRTNNPNAVCNLQSAGNVPTVVMCASASSNSVVVLVPALTASTVYFFSYWIGG